MPTDLWRTTRSKVSWAFTHSECWPDWSFSESPGNKINAGFHLFDRLVFSSSLHDLERLTSTLWNLPWTVLTFLPRFGRHYRTGLDVGIKVAHRFWVNLPYKARTERRHRGLFQMGASQPEVQSVKSLSSHSLSASSLTAVTHDSGGLLIQCAKHRTAAQTAGRVNKGGKNVFMHFMKSKIIINRLLIYGSLGRDKRHI